MPVISQKMGRTVDAIHWKASSLGIQFKQKNTILNIVELFEFLSNKIDKIEENIRVIRDLLLIENETKYLKNAFKNSENRVRNKWIENYNMYSSGQRGGKITCWVKKNREQYESGELSDIQINLLKNIDFYFEKPSNVLMKKWEERFALYEKGVRGHEMQQWEYRNRMKYKLGNLTKEQIKKLQSINFKFEVVKTERWDKTFEDFKNGLKSAKITQWKYNTIHRYRRGKLTEYQINKLKSINFEF